jgi:CheY-like chemotaxis protein
LLAGRKLLLADDSITIQKVVDLTFVDEGVNVKCVNNGREAIQALAEFSPDVVLADVYMPEMNGYQVCEYIKGNEEFRHIPVLLLVGSFEPFDEQEARRVGANDTLTKPFQSIRRLIEKVGLLSSSRPSEEQIPTAELPHHEEPPAEQLSTAELEITTADTQPLPPELRHVVDEATPPETASASAPETNIMNSQVHEGADEVLLDLGDLKQGRSVLDDEFVLDLDLDESPEPSPAEPAFSATAFRDRESYRSLPNIQPTYAGSYEVPAPTPVSTPTTDPLAITQEYVRVVDDEVEPATTEAESQQLVQEYSTQVETQEVVPEYSAQVEAEQVVPQYSQQVEPEKLEREYSPQVEVESVSPAPVQSSVASAQQLSPEMIDAIARRAVEQLSEKVVQEIAWEVVPQLAELLIKRQLEEKNS